MFSRVHSTIAIALIAAFMGAVVPARAQTLPNVPDVVYATPGPRHELDLYIPPNPCGKWPLVIFVYGGGWIVGDKADVAPYVDALLARGFAVASINYRYSYQSIFPAQIFDVKGAIRWLRAHANDTIGGVNLNLDPTRFAIFGESSGGQLSALAGSSAGVSSLEGIIGGNRAQSSAVQAVGVFCAPTDLITLAGPPSDPFDGTGGANSDTVAALFGFSNHALFLDAVNTIPAVHDLAVSGDPATHATSNDPPFFIVNGDQDHNVPYISQAQHLHNAIIAAGGTSTNTVLPGVRHDVPVWAFLPVFDAFRLLLIPPPKIGDVNCDGVVNVNDLLLVINSWGPCANGIPCPDTNGDGSVDVNDLLAVITHWG